MLRTKSFLHAISVILIGFTTASTVGAQSLGSYSFGTFGSTLGNNASISLSIGEPIVGLSPQIKAGSIFILPIVIPTNSEEEEIKIAIGNKLELRSIYPNPSSGAVHFEMSVPDPGPVRLSLFDLLGRERAVLLDADAESGTIILTWEGHDDSPNRLPSGIYLVHLQSANQTEAKFVTLLH